MTQRQVDEVHAFNTLDEFRAVHWAPDRVHCQLDDRFSLIVKRCNQTVYVLLRSGQKRIKIPYDVFNSICNSQITVDYLKYVLETQCEQPTFHGLCCFCGQQFTSKKECTDHETHEHDNEQQLT